MSLIPQVGRDVWRVRYLLIGITAFLCLGIVLHFIPFWWAITASIKPTREIYIFPPTLFPKEPTWEAWRALSTGMGLMPMGEPTVITEHSIWLYIKNSFIISGAIVGLQVSITSLAAYSLSKLVSPRWNKLMLLFFIGTILVPSGVSLIPKYLLLRFFPVATKNVLYIPFTEVRIPSINLTGGYWGIILPSIAQGFSILLFKGFFDGLPDELINAARLDGSSEIGIFRRIILPLSRPVFAVVAYISFNSAWNDFLWPLIVLRGSNKLPLSVALYEFQEKLLRLTSGELLQENYLETGLGMNAIMAFAIVQSIPVFIMFIIFREQLMRGIRLRGFK